MRILKFTRLLPEQKIVPVTINPDGWVWVGPTKEATAICLTTGTVIEVTDTYDEVVKKLKGV